MLDTGVEAPTFSLSTDSGETVSLEDHRGSWVALWWYPEAGSSGCSVQAASLQRSREAFEQEGIVLLGISFNTVEENNAFACDAALGLTLLSDGDHTIGEAYQVVRDPSDRHPTKPHRHTYVIDPDGRVAYAEDANDVALATYGSHLLDTVRSLRAVAPSEA
jgi:peroxiredoxin Q/BCP